MRKSVFAYAADELEVLSKKIHETERYLLELKRKRVELIRSNPYAKAVTNLDNNRASRRRV